MSDKTMSLLDLRAVPGEHVCSQVGFFLNKLLGKLRALGDFEADDLLHRN